MDPLLALIFGILVGIILGSLLVLNWLGHVK